MIEIATGPGQRLDNLPRRDHGTERRKTTVEPFPEYQDVGHDTEMLEGEPAAGATHAAHHFVGDEQHVVTPADLPSSLIVVAARHDGPRRGPDG